MKNATGTLSMANSEPSRYLKKGKIIIDITSLLFIILFLYTGISKLLDYDAFSVQAGFSPILRPFANVIGLALPIIEITIALMFFNKKTQIPAIYISNILMCIFTLYIIWMLLSDSNLPCTCGGVIKQMSWREHLIFNLFFVLLSTLSILVHRKGARVSRSSTYS